MQNKKLPIFLILQHYRQFSYSQTPTRNILDWLLINDSPVNIHLTMCMFWVTSRYDIKRKHCSYHGYQTHLKYYRKDNWTSNSFQVCKEFFKKEQKEYNIQEEKAWELTFHRWTSKTSQPRFCVCLCQWIWFLLWGHPNIPNSYATIRWCRSYKIRCFRILTISTFLENNKAFYTSRMCILNAVCNLPACCIPSSDIAVLSISKK